MHIDVGASDVDVTTQDDLAPLFVQLLRPRRESAQEAELRGIILSAVGHVGRSDHKVTKQHLYDARFHVEFGMAELGFGIEQTLPDVYGDARVSTKTVPVRVIVRELAPLGNLCMVRLQFL